MNKRIILAELAKIANELDKNNLFSEANDVTKVMNDVGKKKGGGGFFDQPGVMGGPRFPHVDEMMEQYSNRNLLPGESGTWGSPSRTNFPQSTKPKPPLDLGPFLPDLDLGPFLPDEDIESSPEQNPSESEEMGSSSMNAVVERSLDEDVIVRYPGPTGKRHIIEWNVKTPAWPGQEIVVDWETNRLKRILDTDEYQKRQNVEMMKSPKNMDR
jgi:hypothetical protein